MDGHDDMKRRLKEAMGEASDNAFHMDRAIDQGNLDDAIKYAQTMLRELRVGNLSPKTYYELWMKIFDHLRQLHSYFLELNKKGMPMEELYRKVQATSHIIPRLYLMITAGAAFITSEQAPAKEVLQDLIEMSKGVQHPLRGLFLRNYLLKMTQDKLSSDFNVDSDFCISYILQNFGEMNRLWVRMQHQGNSKNRTRREKERQDLKVLISFNLVYLSEFEVMNLELYKSSVLEKILDLITNCKDKIAQQYLLDVLVQIFPCKYHIVTLSKLFESFELLEASVQLNSILISLMERIKNSDVDEEEEEEEEGEGEDRKRGVQIPEQTFTDFNDCIVKTISERQGMTPEDILDLYVALLDFSVTCYPGQLEYIDKVLGLAADFLKKQDSISSTVDSLVVRLLKVPLKEKDLGSIDLLGLSHYPNLMSLLSWSSKKKVAHGFLLHVLNEDTLALDNVENVTTLLSFISPLVKDDETSSEDSDSSTFEAQQESVAKLIHRLKSDSPETLFKILGVARKHFGKGGVKRIRYTLVPLCFRYLMLVDVIIRCEQQEVSLRKVFQYVHEIASALAGVVALQEVALKMFLQAALMANRAKEQEVAYEFMAQAFTLYEDVADSKEQLRILPLLIGTLQCTTVFDKESYETLITKTAQYSARLLKKPDQCQMVYTCSHLFWSLEPERTLGEGEEPPAPGKDSKRALECLQRCLKIADSCLTQSVHVALFVDILNRYVYFFDAGMDKIKPQNVGDLITLIKENLSELEEKEEIETYFNNTLAHIKSSGDKYKELNL